MSLCLPNLILHQFLKASSYYRMVDFELWPHECVSSCGLVWKTLGIHLMSNHIKQHQHAHIITFPNVKPTQMRLILWFTFDMKFGICGWIIGMKTDSHTHTPTYALALAYVRIWVCVCARMHAWQLLSDYPTVIHSCWLSSMPAKLCSTLHRGGRTSPILTYTHTPSSLKCMLIGFWNKVI